MTELSQSDHAPPPSDQSNQVDQLDGLEEPSKVAEDSDLNNEISGLKVAIEKLQHHLDALEQRHNVLTILTRIDERTKQQCSFCQWWKNSSISLISLLFNFGTVMTNIYLQRQILGTGHGMGSQQWNGQGDMSHGLLQQDQHKQISTWHA